jgi:pilus assembly protein CpaB
MRAKSLILLVIALGCGMIAAVGVSKAIMDKAPAEVEEATAEIFVAVKDLPHAQKVSADAVKLEKWPRSRLPEGALTSLTEVEGKYTNQQIFAGEPILARKLADSRESFSTTIPPGYRVFDIPGSAGYIKPGDHVDILGTFPATRGGVSETRTVMRNVQVFGIDGNTKRDADTENTAGRGSVFQLLVKESQLEALTLANSMATLRMNLRPFGEDSQEVTDNGESFLNWINESEEGPSKPVTKQSIAEVEQTANNLFPSGGMQSTPPPAKHEMVIITPAGMKKYQWNEETELPQEVFDSTSQNASGESMGAPSSQFSAPGANVYSGYGGYTPTYPTSTVPALPAAGASAPMTSNPPASSAPAGTTSKKSAVN